ncbi:hypothetical protein D917_02960 [Trichinella nativa]|uniref:Uncharacterized protein n=1 Tax=Trichinella nativa TaxID=6335 RepID=A0A1Y3ECL4_9BILA|nr:hypothetical protein D917_02960 [Trichinella nativa]
MGYGGEMKRIKKRLSQAFRPTTTLLACSGSQVFPPPQDGNPSANGDSVNMRCSRSANCLMNDSISELAERFHENGLVEDEGDWPRVLCEHLEIYFQFVNLLSAAASHMLFLNNMKKHIRWYRRKRIPASRRTATLTWAVSTINVSNAIWPIVSH